jgi:sulfotransferase family protein
MTTSTEQAGGEHATGGRVPDFFIVGHHKSGTTAMYEMLRRHPQIFMPDLKEPRFFASDLRRRAGSRVSWLPDTLEEYMRLFDAAEPEQQVGEASPLYLASQTAASGISEVQPHARIIAILREPASFLRSLHLQFVQNYIESEKDLRTALALEDERREGRSMPRRFHMPQMLMYAEHVRYVEQLRRFHAVFPREQVLVLIYDDFRADNEATVRRVLRFLEVDDAAPIEAIEVNPSVHVRSVRLNDLVRGFYIGRGPVWRTVKAAVKAATPRRLRRKALASVHRRVVYGAPQAPDAELMLELRRRFKPEVVALSEYLDRDLVSLWGYDHLD